MEIYIVYDPLCERFISAHETEKGAMSRCSEEDEKDGRNEPDSYYRHEYIKCVLEK